MNTSSEIRRLEKLKNELVQRTYKLRDELAKAENNISRKRRIPVDNLTKLCDNPNGNDDSTVIDKSSARLCEALQSVLGVQFTDVQKNWSHDNVYRYNSHVVTKAIQFTLELTVNVKDGGEDEIEDINCHFANANQSYLREITPWVQRFTKDKDFSYLISDSGRVKIYRDKHRICTAQVVHIIIAHCLRYNMRMDSGTDAWQRRIRSFSDYSDQSTIRAKILSSIKSKGYITLEKCNDDGGGILIYVHPPKAEDRKFFKIQWYTQFMEKTWRIEHIFAIDPVQADEEFIRDHKELLQSFCRIGLKKDDLEEFWDKLCRAIDQQ